MLNAPPFKQTSFIHSLFPSKISRFKLSTPPCSVSDGELYSATVSDFSGSDPLIYKEPLRTDQSDSKHLNCECHYAL